MAGWTVRLARQAEQDIAAILAWTAEHFSPQQAEIYGETLSLALEALLNGPDVLGAQQREDIRPGIRVLHVTRQGRRGRHVILFRIPEDHYIDVLRVLHDSMDLVRHVK